MKCCALFADRIPTGIQDLMTLLEVLQEQQVNINMKKSINRRKNTKSLINEVKAKPEEQAQVVEQPQNIHNADSKAERLRKKKEAKFDADIDRCIKQILNKQHRAAFGLLKDMILTNEFLQKQGFVGVGNNENWQNCYPDGPLQWFANPRQQTQSSRNPFDLLSVCCMVELQNDKKNMESIDKIIQVYQQISSKLGERIQIYVGVGNAYYNNCQTLKAEKNYLKAIEIKKTEKLLEYMAWVKGFWFDQDSLAIQYSDQCLAMNPENVNALCVKGLCQEDEYEQRKIQEEILKKHPYYFNSYIFISKTYHQLQQKLAWLDKAISLNPRSSFGYCRKALAYKRNGNIEAARQMANKAMEIDPNYCFVYWTIGDIELELKDYSQALQNFEKCLEINPYDLQALKSIANLYRMEYDLEQSVTYYKKYLELNPYDYDVFNYIGLAYDELQKKQEAIESYRNAVELNPTFFQALSNLGLSYQQDQNYQEAIKCYKRAHELEPNNGGICYGIAIGNDGIGNPEQAEKWALMSIDKGGDDDKQVFQFLGDLYQKRGIHQKSLQWYLKHTNTTRELNTEYIMTNLISHMDRSAASELLEKALNHTYVEQENQYTILEIGKLYIAIEEYEQALKSFKILQSLGSGSTRTVREELRKFFGDPSMGVYFMADKCKLMNLKKQYEASFTSFYAQDNQ